MITIKVDLDTKGLEQFRQFSDRRVKAAIATTLTRTAREVQKDWGKQLSGKLEKPTALTMRSVNMEQATAQSLVATVAVVDRIANDGIPPAEYLGTQERGGTRDLKKFERAMVSKGAMLADQRAVPARGARLDGFGNVSRGQIVEVLNQIVGAAQLSPGYRKVISRKAEKRAASAKRAGKTYVAFPKQVGAVPPGVYWQQKRALEPIFYFVNRAMYGRKLDLIKGSRDTVAKVLQAQWDRALRESAARLMAK